MMSILKRLSRSALLIASLATPMTVLCAGSPGEEQAASRCKSFAEIRAIDAPCAIFLMKQEMRARKINPDNFAKFEATFSGDGKEWVVYADFKEPVVDAHKLAFLRLDGVVRMESTP